MEVELPPGTTSPSAIQKAAYRLAPKVSITIIGLSDAKITVEVATKGEFVESEVLSEFREFLTDYTLREKISEKTEGVRTLLLAQAFSSVLNSYKDELHAQEEG